LTFPKQWTWGESNSHFSHAKGVFCH